MATAQRQVVKSRPPDGLDLGVAADWLRRGSASLDVLDASLRTLHEIETHRAKRLARLLETATSLSAWYRKAVHGRASTPFAEWPPVQKTELMRHFSEWVTDPALELAALRDFARDASRIGEPYLGRYAVWESSGSSGEPGLFVQDEQALAVYDALEAHRSSVPRPWQRLMDPWFLGERLAFIGATDGHFASQVSVQRLRRRCPWLASTLRSYSILQPLDRLVEQLNVFAPTIIATYPTAAVQLADQACHGALRVRLRECWTGGETLSPAMRADIEKTLGCAVRNSYGASEFLSMASECRQGRLHLNSDWLILEPVDRQYRPVPAGETGHTTLLTNLANCVQPLIRYDLGDQVTLAAQRCACGSPLPVIEVSGRSDDCLRLRGEGRRVLTLVPLALATVLEEGAGLFDFQLRQRDMRTLELRVGARGGDGTLASQRGLVALRAYLREQGLGGVRVIESPGLAPEQGRSGKVKRVMALPELNRRAARP